MYRYFFHRPNTIVLIYIVPVLAAAFMGILWRVNVSAQTNCQPPSVQISYGISGQITNETGMPLEGVGLYSGPGSPLVTTGQDGSWRATFTICTLSPPRCGTGFNSRVVPVSTGYFFSPNSGEICPNNVINFVARPAPFTNVSAASYKNALAPGSIATAFAAAGSALALGTESATKIPLPESLAGTRVTVKGFTLFGMTTNKAPLYFVSPTQVNYYLPPDVREGPSEITIQTANGLTLNSSVSIARVAPALFSANSNGQGVAAAVALRIKADATQEFEPVARFDPVENLFVPLPIDLGQPTDQVFLILFGTGFRLRSSLENVTATIGGVDAQVTFAGAQESLVGLDQANLLLNRSLQGRGELDVMFTVDGNLANTVKIAVK